MKTLWAILEDGRLYKAYSTREEARKALWNMTAFAVNQNISAQFELVPYDRRPTRQ